MAAGGKRFRPMLALLAAQLGDPDAPEVIVAPPWSCELTHLATLYHDDVMDEAAVRRGAPSANSRWSNSVAILTGDLLFARASDLLADLGPEAVRIQARTFERLVTGQIRETVGARPGEDPVAHHLAVLADKTGSLVATSARFGAGFAGVDASLVEALTAFGEEVGVAFQLSDDLLDIVSEGGASGKSPGTDLREGIATLPVAVRPGRRRPGRGPAARAGRRPRHRRRRARRGARAAALVGARWPAPPRCCASTPTGPAPGWTPSPPATCATRCPPCATTWSPAPAEAAMLRGRAHLAAGPCMAAVLVLAAVVRAATSVRRARAADARRPARPRSRSTVVPDGLDHPWDVAQAPDGTLLVDERGGGFTAVLPDGTRRSEVAGRLRRPLRARARPGSWGSPSTPASPTTAASTPARASTAAAPSIAVIAWTVAPDWSAATRVADPLVGGIPVNQRARAGTAAAGCGSTPTGRC